MERILIDILGGLSIGLVMFEAGRTVSTKKMVGEDTCKERREGCIHMVSLQIENLTKKIDSLCASASTFKN